MQFTTALLLALQATFALTSPAPAPAADLSTAQLEAECGSLHANTYNKTALPSDVDPAQIRHCVEHPSGTATEENTLGKRDCVPGSAAQYGCGRGGYCWKRCGGSGGSWCWQAVNNGWGDWIKCTASSQCAPQSGWECGLSEGDCNACGCSCTGGLPF
ncbi:IDI-2 precursor [Podospora comata]|uniref:IDI-2 n=1 Tax=Podospora comata TaxID=48703 RepID=A0ABY6SCP5_PODCO|nr:IDI-2 precursor [Podospora comata]